MNKIEVLRILMHEREIREREIRENRKLRLRADVSRKQTACTRWRGVFPTPEINAK